MEKALQFIEAFLSNPILWGVVALLALSLALSGRLSVNAAVAILWTAWGAATFTVFRIVAHQDVVLRLLLLVAVSSSLAIGAVLLSRWYVMPGKLVAQSPPPPLSSPNRSPKTPPASETRPELVPPPIPSTATKHAPAPESKPPASTKPKATPNPRLNTPFGPFDLAKQHLNSDPDRLTLYDLFLLDFPSAETQSLSGFTVNATKTHVEWSVVRNIEEGSELIKLYIPFAEDTAKICMDFVRPNFTPNYEYVLSHTDIFVVTNRDQLSSRTLTFSKRVFIYHMYDLSPQEAADINTAYVSKGLIVVLRDVNYLDKKQVDAKLKLLQK